jgi:hypothetical protein
LYLPEFTDWRAREIAARNTWVACVGERQGREQLPPQIVEELVLKWKKEVSINAKGATESHF